MKKLFFSIIIIAFAITISSCNPVTNQEVGIPETIIPANVLKKFVKYMEIYKGESIPDITGEYVSAPHTLVYDKDSGRDENDEIVFGDYYFRFVSQNNTIHFEAMQDSVIILGNNLTFMGDGKNFTTYFIGEGQTNGIYNKKSFLISGEVTETGIRNFYYAFIMLEKGHDPDDELMDVNEYRILKDGNAEASRWGWPGKGLLKGMTDDKKLR